MVSMLALATELLLAELRAGQLAPSAVLPRLQEIHAHLLGLPGRAAGTRAPGLATDAPVPAGLSWQASITRDSITCLECGALLQWLNGQHLQKHGLDVQAYRRKYGIPRTQPLAAHAVTARRQRLIRQQRPWTKAPTYRQAQARHAAARTRTTPRQQSRQRPPRPL